MPFRGWRDCGAGMVFMETLFRFSALHFRSVLHFGLCSFVREMDGLILDDFICKYVLTYARGTMHLQSSTVDNARVFSFLFYFSIIPFCYFFFICSNYYHRNTASPCISVFSYGRKMLGMSCFRKLVFSGTVALIRVDLRQK